MKDKVLLAETNEVLNIPELAKKLQRSEKAVSKRIYLMRKDGELPKVERDRSFDSKGRPWTASEEKRLIAMHKQGASYQEIADALGRTKLACANKGAKLTKSGKLKIPKKCSWSQQDIEKLIRNIQFDENGYVSNYTDLSRLLGKRYEQITQKVSLLRKDGRISQQADRTKTSVKSRKAMDKFNETRFAYIPKKEEKQMEQEISSSHSNLSNAVSVDSKEVTIILTTITINDHTFQQYFSKDGRLIAKKELTTPASN